LCSKEQFLRQKAANTKLSTAVELLLSEKYEEAYSDLKNFEVGLDKKDGLFSLFLEAEILYKTASYSKSFELYDSILAISNTSKDMQFYAFINAGNIKFHAQKKYHASITYYLQAQNLVEDSDCQDKKILTYEGLGNSYLFSSQYKKSEGYYKELLGIYQQRKDQRNISRAYSNLANLFYEQYQDKKAEDYFLKVLNAVENTSFIKVKQQVLYNLHMVNKGLGKHKEALDYLSQSNILKDSIWNRDKVWELAEKDKEISIAQKDKELFIQTEKTERQTRRLQWGAGILVLTLLFLGTLFYSYKTKVRQNQIITAQKGELEKLNHTKNYLFSVISHDLRSPVKMLIKQQKGFLKKLKKGETTALEETAGSALNIAESLNHLLNNVLHWSLEQNDQMIFNQQVQPISPVINQVLFDFRLLSEEKDITLESDLDDELFINVDRESIKVVLRNLLDNAIKYTPENGMITVSTAIEGDLCQIQVRDSGMGISEEQLERINSLQALSIDKINRSKGIGLGLLLCTSLTKKNGGSFQVTSQLNKGTQIQMTFPVAEEA
jgi:signal transduction histidine kinase